MGLELLLGVGGGKGVESGHCGVGGWGGRGSEMGGWSDRWWVGG